MQDSYPIHILEEFSRYLLFLNISSCTFGTSFNSEPFEIDKKGLNLRNHESMLRHIFIHEEKQIMEDASVYYIDAVDISPQQRENIAEIIFETFSCKRLILGYRPLLAGLYFTSTFTSDEEVSGVIIDIGKVTRITPIV